jgi:hypothetical protein
MSIPERQKSVCAYLRSGNRSRRDVAATGELLDCKGPAGDGAALGNALKAPTLEFVACRAPAVPFLESASVAK